MLCTYFYSFQNIFFTLLSEILYCHPSHYVQNEITRLFALHCDWNLRVRTAGNGAVEPTEFITKGFVADIVTLNLWWWNFIVQKEKMQNHKTKQTIIYEDELLDGTIHFARMENETNLIKMVSFLHLNQQWYYITLNISIFIEQTHR